MRYTKGSPVWGVIEPGSKMAEFWMPLLATDAVVLASPRIARKASGQFVVRIKVSALCPAKLVQLCRKLSQVWNMSEAGVFLEAIQGDGLWIDAKQVFICTDPAIGREFFATRDRAGKGGDR